MKDYDCKCEPGDAWGLRCLGCDGCVEDLRARVVELEKENDQLQVEVGELRRLVFDIEPSPSVSETKFSAFMREIEAEAKAEGPEAVANLEALRAHYRGKRQRASEANLDEEGRCLAAGCYWCRGSGDWTKCPRVQEADRLRTNEAELNYACVACGASIIATGMCERCSRAWGMGRDSVARSETAELSQENAEQIFWNGIQAGVEAAAKEIERLGRASANNGDAVYARRGAELLREYRDRLAMPTGGTGT